MNILDVQFRRLLDMVEYFKDRLEHLHNDLPKLATPAKPSGFISGENLVKEFKAGVEELVEDRFPEMVLEMRGLAESMTSLPGKSRSDDSHNTMGDRHQEDISGKGGRKSAPETSTITPYKKRLREDDNDGAEDVEQHQTHQKLTPLEPLDRLGYGETSTSTSGKRTRAADSDDGIGYCHPKRLRKALKGKAKETVMADNDHGETYASESTLQQQQPGRHILDMEAIQSVALQSEFTASGSMATSTGCQGTAHQTFTDEDEDEIRSESASRWPTSACRSDPLPGPAPQTNPGQSHHPNRPTIRIIRHTPY